MHDRILKRMQAKILALEYIMTLHAEEEMSDDGFTVLDVEHGILTGVIAERQRDAVTAEVKHVIHGLSEDGRMLSVAVKLSPTGRLVIITVFEMED